jgi:hypothetical protein
MSLILSGSDGLSDVDGSAATPAIRGTDANTGIFFPAADTIAFSEGGVEAARFDSSGNFGLGVTPSAWASDWEVMQIGSRSSFAQYNSNSSAFMVNNIYYAGTSGSNPTYINTAAASLYQQVNGGHNWFTAPSGTAGSPVTVTQSMTLDVSGSVFIGDTVNTTGSPTFYVKPKNGLVSQIAGLNFATTSAAASPSNNLISSGSYYNGTTFVATNTTAVTYQQNTALHVWYTDSGLTAGNTFAPTERVRIDSSGNLLVGTTSGYSGRRLDVRGSSGDFLATLTNGNAAPFGWQILYNGANPNNTTSSFITAQDAAERFTVRSNGGVANYSANNVNLSDRHEKTNFAPAKSYLNVICAIPVQTYNYIDQNLEEDGGLTLGVVAQDVQAVAPELVTESDWSVEKDGSKMRLSIYQTDMQYALMKCIQEQQALITSLTARITALETP